MEEKKKRWLDNETPEKVRKVHKVRKAPLPRDVTFNGYGISPGRYKELSAVCQSGEHAEVVRAAAYAAAPDIAEYILLSVTKTKSYESVEFDPQLGRIPCGKTDFYGYRRLFYHHLDQLLRKE